jgi:hypothetical protein
MSLNFLAFGHFFKIVVQSKVAFEDLKAKAKKQQYENVQKQ